MKGKSNLLAVVEDDDDIRETVAEMLAGEGYEVLAARNGKEALELLRHANPLPSLIFLDLMMPVLDGAGFRAEQRRDPRLKDIPIVVLSASTQLATIAADLGVSGMLAKPISLRALLDIAARYCPSCS